jgi:hypothetical protein
VAVKMTMIFAVTTQPVNPNAASAHSGGWTESFWTSGNSYISLADQDLLLAARAPLLPKQASIVGIRQGLYTISQNKLLPQGTSGRKILRPGNSLYNVNLPQDSLELSGTSQTSINSNRFRLGCLPDEVTAQGEYSPTPAFTLSLTSYTGRLALGGQAWSFVGRVLSNPSARVLSITPGLGGTATIVVSANINPTAGVSYVRLHRVYDENNNPIKGTFLVASITNPTTYVISGYGTQTVTDPSGTTRLDQVALYQFSEVVVSRAVVKKIGRPSSSYRGRQSNRTRV